MQCGSSARCFSGITSHSLSGIPRKRRAAARTCRNNWHQFTFVAGGARRHWRQTRWPQWSSSPPPSPPTPTALSGFPGEDAGSQAAAAALLRAHCEGIACCQDSSGAITHQVAAAVGALHYGLVALEASGADAETGQRRRQRRHAERHPLAGYHALGTLVQHAAAALAAVVLQCAAAEAVAFARSRAGEHAADHQHPHSLPKHYCQQQPAGLQQQEKGQQRTSRRAHRQQGPPLLAVLARSRWRIWLDMGSCTF